MEYENKKVSKSKAIEKLKGLIGEIPHLRTLKYENQEIKPWLTRVNNLLSLAFDDEDYQKFTNAELRSAMRIMGDEVHQDNYQHNLTTRKTILQSILDKHEILEIEEEYAVQKKPKDTAKLPMQLFDALQLHPDIVAASKSLFESEHYAQAILEAFKTVNNSVKKLTGLSLDGKALMSRSFNEEKPLIALNKLSTQSERDEQEGFKFLFMGAMLGIRNPLAHEDFSSLIEPRRTFEYLGFASLLMGKIEETTLE